MKAIIVGGGVGGLTATLSLKEAGWDVVVLERATLDGKKSDLIRGGAGITIWPNGTELLDRFGVLPNLPEIKVPLKKVVFRDTAGKVIYDDPHGEFPERYGRPSMPLHRADLLQGLIATVGEENVAFGREFASYRQSADSVVVTTAGGEEFEGDILVGADGIGSPIRGQVVGDGDPVYTGLTGWRGVAPGPVEGMEPGEGGNTWGRGEEFGWMPIVDGRIYWYSATAKLPLLPMDAPREPERWKEQALARYGGWHAPIRELIEATPVETVIYTGLFYRLPVTNWGDGRVTLLGDAAHAMEPHLAQGACQAMEDALVLGRQLAANPSDPVAALRAYEAERHERANWLVKMSERMGKTIHLSNPVVCGVRNKAMRGFFKRAGMKRHDRIVTGPSIPKPLEA